MTIVQQIRSVAETADHRARLGEFLKVAQLTMLHGGGAAHSEDAERATERVQRILKGIVAPIDTIAGGAAIAELQPLSEAFSASLIGLSVFDTALANGMRRVPLRSRGVIITTAPTTGSGVGEGQAKPISEMSFGVGTLEPQKAWSCVAATADLFNFANPGATVLFSDELRKAVSRSTDALFLSQIIVTTTPIASAGNTFANVMTDLAALLAAVDVQPGSRLFLVLPTSKAKAWALLPNPQGGLAFPLLNITTGGPLAAGVEALISDQLPANRMLLIVTDGLVGNSDAFEMRKLRQGDIQVNTAPDSPPTAATTLRSLWQNNLIALAVERWFGFEIVRTRAVASLSYT